MVVTGYKVLIDGKQYGSAMHEGIKTVRIKLGVEQPVYRLSMLSMTEKPQSTSEDSNVVELLSENFRPFTFYCYHSVHAEGAKWPNQGCCKFSDSLAYERHAAKKLANQGLLKRRVPPPSCSLLDIFDGEYKPFLSTHNKQFATAVLFWTPCYLDELAKNGRLKSMKYVKEEKSKQTPESMIKAGMDKPVQWTSKTEGFVPSQTDP